MKKALSLILALVLCLSLCACGGSKLSPKERLNDDVKEYISENYRITIGGSTSEAVNVDIASVVDMEENKWAVLEFKRADNATKRPNQDSSKSKRRTDIQD